MTGDLVTNPLYLPYAICAPHRRAPISCAQPRQTCLHQTARSTCPLRLFYTILPSKRILLYRAVTESPSNAILHTSTSQLGAIYIPQGPLACWYTTAPPVTGQKGTFKRTTGAQTAPDSRNTVTLRFPLSIVQPGVGLHYAVRDCRSTIPRALVL